MKVEWVASEHVLSQEEHERACACCADRRIPVVRVEELRELITKQMNEHYPDTEALDLLTNILDLIEAK